MRRFLMICFVWLGFVGMAEAGGRPVFDYIPEVWGMDFSTAKKPHVEVPGGEWHMISGDGTIYPDIINYCDPDESPECLGHMYVACWAWSGSKINEIGKKRRPPICEEVGVIHATEYFPLYATNGDINSSFLFYYKLDSWKPSEMIYYEYDGKSLPPADEIPFEKDTVSPKRWRGEWSVDIYYGYCRPDYACLANKGKRDLPLTETDKFCPLQDCYGYGFEDAEDVTSFNRPRWFVYPQVSIAFPAFRKKEGEEIYPSYKLREKYILTNHALWHYRNSRGLALDAPARWLPGHPLSVHE